MEHRIYIFKNLIKSTGRFSDEIINHGKWFPANFDKPNDLVATFNYFFPGVSVSRLIIPRVRGRPITYPISTYNIGDNLLIHYSDRNKYRIPDYSRLDLSLR